MANLRQSISSMLSLLVLVANHYKTCPLFVVRTDAINQRNSFNCVISPLCQNSSPASHAPFTMLDNKLLIKIIWTTHLWLPSNQYWRYGPFIRDRSTHLHYLYSFELKWDNRRQFLYMLVIRNPRPISNVRCMFNAHIQLFVQSSNKKKVFLLNKLIK